MFLGVNMGSEGVEIGYRRGNERLLRIDSIRGNFMLFFFFLVF